MEEKIIDIICKFANLKPGDLPADATFKAIGLSSSVKLIRMQRMLEKETQMSFPAIFPTSIIGDVLKINNAGADTHAGPKQSSVQVPVPQTEKKATPLDISIGIDIDEVENFPKSSDYLNDDFYLSVFHPSEIKYALGNKEPRIHLCGMFCAKEALIKSHPSFNDVKMKDIIILHSDNGQPSIDLADKTKKKFNTKLSISHTEKYATAVVLCQGSY